MSDDPAKAYVHVTPFVVVKTHVSAARFEEELRAYQACSWAAPRLIGVDHPAQVLVMEKCTPLDQMEPDPDHARQLWSLLERLHTSGWNHRDCSVGNAVWHSKRGVLLIDWETAIEVDPSRPSWDLYGARASGMPQEWVVPHQRPDGVWWGTANELSPARWWGWTKENTWTGTATSRVPTLA